MKTLDNIALTLLIVGGLNWLLVGLFKFDLVAMLFGGQAAIISRIVYVLVGLSALYCIKLFAPINSAQHEQLSGAAFYRDQTSCSSQSLSINVLVKLLFLFNNAKKRASQPRLARFYFFIWQIVKLIRTLFGQKRSASFKMVFTTNPSFRS